MTHPSRPLLLLALCFAISLAPLTARGATLPEAARVVSLVTLLRLEGQIEGLRLGRREVRRQRPRPGRLSPPVSSKVVGRSSSSLLYSQSISTIPVMLSKVDSQHVPLKQYPSAPSLRGHGVMIGSPAQKPALSSPHPTTLNARTNAQPSKHRITVSDTTLVSHHHQTTTAAVSASSAAA